MAAAVAEASLAAEESVASSEAVLVAAEELAMVGAGEAAAAAMQTAQQTFAGSGVSEGLPQETIDAGEVESLGMIAALVKVGFAKSNGEARRLIRGGGARLNDTAVTDEDFQLGAGDFIDGRAKISAGKKRHALLVIS